MVTNPDHPTSSSASAGGAAEAIPWTLERLRARRDEILHVAAIQHASGVTIGSLDPLQLIVDFGAQASLMNQAALSCELEDLLDTPVQVDSRRARQATTGVPGGSLEGAPL